MPELPLKQESFPIQQSQAATSDLSRPTKACPFCGEEVLAVAKKCKHCSEILDVVLRAAEEAKQAAHRAAAGSSAAASSSTTVVMQQGVDRRRSFPHLLHFFATFITAGLWLPIWILHYLFRNRLKYY